MPLKQRSDQKLRDRSDQIEADRKAEAFGAASGLLTVLGPDAEEYLTRAAISPAQVLRSAQSNTSLRFGDAVIVKLFRKFQPGVNPDEEALRGLSAQKFAPAPAFVG